MSLPPENKFRQTIFCSNNPYKELNPAKHMVKRPMDKILNQLNINDISLNGQKQQITNANQQTYFYNKVVESQPQVQVQTNGNKKVVGKKLFDDKLKENVGRNIIANPPINVSDQLNVRKASGQYYQGKNTESNARQAYYPNSLNNGQCKKKMFDSRKANKGTITTELTDNVNHYDKYQPKVISQKRQIPQKTSIKECFNDYPQSTRESNNRENNGAQYQSVNARLQRSTTTHDSYKSGVEYNRPFSAANCQQNFIRKTNAYYKYGTSTTTRQSFYL